MFKRCVKLSKEQALENLKKEFPGFRICFIAAGSTSLAFKVYAVGSKQQFIVRMGHKKSNMRYYKKEQRICNAVRQNVSVKLPDVKLHTSSKYPFVIHEIIRGKTDNYITSKPLAIDIATFLAQLHSFSAWKIRRLTRIWISKPQSRVNFDKVKPLLLRKFSTEDLDIMQSFFKEKHFSKGLFLTHFDFLPINYLTDNNDRLCGVIDFCGAKVARREADFRRLYQCFGVDFTNVIITEYNKLHKCALNPRLVMVYHLRHLLCNNYYHKTVNVDYLQKMINIYKRLYL